MQNLRSKISQNLTNYIYFKGFSFRTRKKNPFKTMSYIPPKLNTWEKAALRQRRTEAARRAG